MEDVTEAWVANDLGSCDSIVMGLEHGVILFVTVKCVNDIELATLEVSKPLQITFDPPTVDQAHINAIPLSDSYYIDIVGDASDTIVQSNQSCLLFHWGGIYDDLQITGYEFELREFDHTLVTGWTSVGKRTMITLCQLKLTSGQLVNGYVRAEGAGSYFSEAVNRSVLISSTSPKLTGMMLQYP